MPRDDSWRQPLRSDNHGCAVLGVERRTAAEFSFFLAVPTMLGSTTLEVFKHRHEIMSGGGVGFGLIAVGFIVSFLVALVVVRAFVHYISRHGFAPFAWYRIIAGAAALAGLRSVINFNLRVIVCRLIIQ